MEASTAPRVLVADDDRDIREIVSTAAEGAGGEVVAVSDGEAAWKTLQTGSIDVAVLDVMMPGMSGLEVCSKLKGTELGRLVPVLILTARDELHEKVHALQNGADDYLTKPFHYQELEARIRAQIRVRRLNVILREKNELLLRMQAELVEKERKLVATQLAGTAAHRLGQPLAALLLHCALLEELEPGGEQFQETVRAIRSDVERMSQLIEGLQQVDGGSTEGYHGKTEILK